MLPGLSRFIHRYASLRIFALTFLAFSPSLAHAQEARRGPNRIPPPPATPTGPIELAAPPITSAASPIPVPAPAASGTALPAPASGTANGAVPVAPPIPAPLPARGAYEITGAAPSLSVFAVGVDAQELFTAIADKANLRLVVDDIVSRSITINIPTKPARQIVDDIVSAYGLSVADVGGVTMISEGIPRSPSSYLLSDIDSIPTKYVDAANARNLLPVFLQDYVKVNAEQNSVVLSAPTEVLAKFREDIAQFDIPAAQILIELQLIELTDTSLDQLGLNFNYNNSNHGGGFNNETGNLVYRAMSGLTDQFRLNLQALQEQGKARVRANPRIATVSGRRASVFVGRQRYVIQPIENNGRSSNFIDAGVRLGITPFTGGQRQVLINVDAEVSTLSAPDPVTRLPEKSTRTASTIVRVNDGQTIVIGGLRQQETRAVKTKVPVLGDLPIIGKALFQSRDVRSAQTELVLFITPRILTDTGHLPEQEEKQLKDTFLNSDLSRSLPPAPPIELPEELRDAFGKRGSTLPLPPELNSGPNLPPPGAMSGGAPIEPPQAAPPVKAPAPARQP